MTYLIEATVILAAIYFVTAFVHGLVRYQPKPSPLPVRIDSEGRDVTELPGLWDESDALPRETLSAMTLTHLRQIAVALNRVHPGTIRKAETRRKDSAITALSKHWQTLIDAKLIEQRLA